MNLYAMFNRGIANSGVEMLKKKQFARDMEAARIKWLNALRVDETRAWMSIGEVSREILTGLAAMLTLAGLCKAADDQSPDSPAIRVIRGAISTAQQCARAGCGIEAQHAQAFSSAATMARGILETCSHVAMAHAAEYLDKSMQEISLAVH